MILTSIDDWHRWIHSYTMLPYVERFPLRQEDVVRSWEPLWHSASECSFVLESGKGGRYTYVGLEPFSTIHGKGDQAVVRVKDQCEEQRLQGPPLQLVEQWMRPYRSPRVELVPAFLGGCVGYWGYDVVRSIEKLPEVAKDDLRYPDYFWMMMDELWIIDHQEHVLYCAVHTYVHPTESSDELYSAYVQAAARVQEMKAFWDDFLQQQQRTEVIQRHEAFQTMIQESRAFDMKSATGWETDFHKEDFVQAVRRIQQYIRQGDVFQVNLSLRQKKQIHHSPEEIYEWLRLLNPSPYMGLLRIPQATFVCGSPELLVKCEGNRVRTRPIAGTRRRGLDAKEDRLMADELLLSEKERAEHIMLVDLERNDLGRICQFGTVQVTELMVLEYYSHVMHIVSEIQGQLVEGKNAFDVIRATFPGGTITGAPKIRTMEIIEELEPVRRGVYTGSIGWMDYNGNMEMNIVIRTLVVTGDTGYVQAGAGIVIDSDPDREYAESLNKAKAIWQAIQCCEQYLQRTETGKKQYGTCH